MSSYLIGRWVETWKPWEVIELCHNILDYASDEMTSSVCPQQRWMFWKCRVTDWLTDWLTDWPAWSTVLLEKLTVAQLVKEFPALYGNRSFITVFPRRRHWSLSWARWIQCAPSHPSSLRSILVLSSHLRPGPLEWSFCFRIKGKFATVLY
jgi:hypothetical protein